MLVLSRKVGEKIIIGGKVTVVVQRVSRNRVALAIEAPEDVRILRGELSPFGEEADESLSDKPLVEQPAAMKQIVDALEQQIAEDSDSSDSFVHQDENQPNAGDSVISRGVDETVILKRKSPLTAK